MQDHDSWLLPEGIDEVLPPQAEQLEGLSRRLLDLYRGWGYELVVPPLIEYLDTLLTGTGNDLDLQTFKLIDQLNGRLMGVRADMTPQVARIDAHHLRRDTPTRLCYLGSVLQTRPDGFAGSRSPLQIGVELYGHGGIESDVEVLALMVQTLAAAGLENPYLDLGHVGIFGALARQAGLDRAQEAALFDALQRKAVPELEELVAGWALQEDAARMLRRLAVLNGGEEVLAEARRELAAAAPAVHEALDTLEQLAGLAARQLPAASLHFDLAELRGYHYHTGVIFAAFVPGRGQAVAQGGRYDGIAKVFGRARPATGFSADLRTVMRLGGVPPRGREAIFAPFAQTPGRDAQIAALRDAGEVVIDELPGQIGGAAQMGCGRELVWRDERWQVVAADNEDV